jgi:hypothetical protein
MKVDHKQVRVILRPVADIPEDVKQENALLDWACSSYQSAMLIVAGGVLAKTRSLDTAASVLWWAGFQAPAGYFTDEDEDAHGDLSGSSEEALRLWVEREEKNIERTVQSKGFYLFATGRLLDEVEE